MYKLKLRTHFSAAHQLTHAYDNKCNDSLHGHNWKVYIEISVVELVNGMVCDFKLLKEIVDKFDHKNLNEILNVEPTAENIAKEIYLAIKAKIKSISLSVEVEENDGASIQYYE